jgi:glycosyltransferase involved in cell wall biosynthesis
MLDKTVRIIHTTISSCENERRIFNQAITADQHGAQVEILALKTPQLKQLSSYKKVNIRRIYIPFWRRGPLKFILFNLRLFFLLLRSNYQILHAHDVWVMPGSVMANMFKRGILVYDAHEFTLGLEIFNRKRFSGFVWSVVEKTVIKKIDALITINPWHQRLFLDKYPKIPESVIIMNYPSRKDNKLNKNLKGFHERDEIVLFQGILKEGRGLRTIVKSMKDVHSGQLHLIGEGDLEDELFQLIESYQLQDSIQMKGKIGWDILLLQTQQARAGLVLFEPHTENYTYASPNKFFEYVMAGTPVIASAIPTFKKFNSEFEVGILVDPSNINEITGAIQRLLSQEAEWGVRHQNCLKAREKWNWEVQEETLLKLYAGLLNRKM